jgi:hypothetical protein
LEKSRGILLFYSYISKHLTKPIYIGIQNTNDQSFFYFFFITIN